MPQEKSPLQAIYVRADRLMLLTVWCLFLFSHFVHTGRQKNVTSVGVGSRIGTQLNPGLPSRHHGIGAREK